MPLVPELNPGTPSGQRGTWDDATKRKASRGTRQKEPWTCKPDPSSRRPLLPGSCVSASAERQLPAPRAFQQKGDNNTSARSTDLLPRVVSDEHTVLPIKMMISRVFVSCLISTCLPLDSRLRKHKGSVFFPPHQYTPRLGAVPGIYLVPNKHLSKELRVPGA